MTRREELDVGPEPSLALRMVSADLRILEGEPGRITVAVDGPHADRFTIEQVGDRVMVEQPSGALRWESGDVTITAPAGVAVRARLASADMEASVTLRDLRADVASGDLRLGHVAGEVRVKSASGDVRTGDISGDLEVTTASGDVRVGTVAGKADVNTASGSCWLESVGAGLSVRSASGDIVVRSYAGADVRMQTMSGDVRIGFPPGRTLEVDLSTLSGDVRNTLGPRADTADGEVHDRVRVYARTISGDITIEPGSRASHPL